MTDAASPAVRSRTFVLTWISYASYYLTRKPLSVAKASLEDAFDLRPAHFALIETPYLVAYAIGQFGNGLLADRLGPRRLIAIGMLATALLSAFFGMSSAFGLFVLAFGLNGLAQSTGWPSNVKAMSAPFSLTERARVMGLWCTCYQVGGLASTALAAFVIGRWGWRATFFAPAVWVAIVGVAIALWLPDAAPEARPAPDSTSPPETPETRETIRGVLRNVRVWRMGACYFCLKLIRYSLLFWLAYYFRRVHGFDDATSGYLSTSFEVGGIAGTIATGFLVARLPTRTRGVVACVMILGLAGAIALYSSVGTAGAAVHFAAMALVGFLLFGPDALVSAVIAQDVGGRDASGTAAGVINGAGSIGAILQGAVTAGVSQRFGWDALFGVFVGLALVAALTLAPEWRRR